MLLLLAALAAPATASPLNPWGPHVGQGVVALTPYLYVDQQPALYPVVYGQVGLTPALELSVGAAATLGSESAFDGLELMPRLFLVDELALALRISTALGPEVGLAPEVHGTWERDAFVLTVNAGWDPWVGAESDPGSVYAFIAPELYLSEVSSLYVEVNPAWWLGEDGGLALELVPGVSTGFADRHWIAVGVAVPVAPSLAASDIYLGAWYSVAFGE